MATYTQNYSLHQWEDTDDFLRTDFNEDFAKIDTALGRAERSATSNAYNIYNLILQNYYESKYTGYKSALLFDGFLTDDEIASRSSSLLHSQERLILTQTGQSDYSLGYGTSSYRFLSTDNRKMSLDSAPSNGYLTGITVKGFHQRSTTTTSVAVSVTVNDSTTDMGSFSLTFSTTDSEFTMTFSQPIPIAMGDALYVSPSSGNSEFELYYPSTGSGIGGTLHFTPAEGDQATMTSQSVTLPEYSRLYGWVRHSGEVALSLAEGTSTYPTTFLSTTDTVNQNGDPCYESAFMLDHTPSGDDIAIQLDLSVEDDYTYAELFDYGLCFL